MSIIYQGLSKSRKVGAPPRFYTKYAMKVCNVHQPRHANDIAYALLLTIGASI